MTVLLAARAGHWEPLAADSIWWQPADGSAAVLLEPREHAALLAAATFRPQDELANALGAQLGLTATRARRLLDALLERGLLLSSDALVTAAVPAATPVTVAADDAARRFRDTANDALRAAARAFTDAGVPGADLNATLLGGAGQLVHWPRQAEWREPAHDDRRLTFASPAYATIQTRACSDDAALHAATLLGATLPQVGDRFGLDRESLAGLPERVAEPFLTGTRVRIVVAGDERRGPQRPAFASPAAATVLALDARELVPFALGEAALEAAWQVVALDAVHGRGSSLALPLFADVPQPTATAVATLAALATAADGMASRDASARLAALGALARDLTAAPDEALARRLRSAHREQIAARIAASSGGGREAGVAELSSAASFACDLAAARALLQSIDSRTESWPALWHAAREYFDPGERHG